MTNVYKIKLFREKWANNDYRDFCIEKNIVAIGWPAKEQEKYKNLTEFVELVNEKYPNDKSWSCARNCMWKEMEGNDYCWTCCGGNDYRLGKITDRGTLFNGNEFHKELENRLNEYYAEHSDKKSSIDLKEFGLWRDCEKWKKIQFDDVPGNVIARFQGTMCRVRSECMKDFHAYCQYLYDGTKPSNKLNFWNLVHYDDLEDLIGLYLQTIGYYVFPSTNKQGTKDYEYKLIHKNRDPETKEHPTAIIQCKHTDDIDIKKLEGYKGNIFLLIINGNIKWGENGEPEDKTEWTHKNEKGEGVVIGWQYCRGKIKVFDAEKLKKWANENEDIMTDRIKKFLELSK